MVSFPDPAMTSTKALPTRWPETFRPDDVTAPVHGVVVKDRVEGDAAAGIGQHAHRTGQLTVTIAGWVGLSVEGTIVALPAGTAAWVPPGIRHEGILGENAASWYVHFAEPLCAELPGRIERFFISNLAVEAARRFLDRTDHFEMDSPMGRLARVLIDEIRAAKRLKPGFAELSAHPVLKTVAEAIIARPDMRLSREDYAKAAGISGRQLSRILSAETGRGFGEWRLEIVMLHATLLLRRELTIEAVAEAVGYSNASAFIVAFKRVFGMTPGAYAARE